MDYNIYVSDMLGPRAAAFDDDDTPEDHIDEDLKNDSVSTMDMTVSYRYTFDPFRHLVGQLNDSL